MTTSLSVCDGCGKQVQGATTGWWLGWKGSEALSRLSVCSVECVPDATRLYKAWKWERSVQ